MPNYIGVGVGAVIGGFTQSPSDNPVAGIAGATIGGILGSYLTKSTTEQVRKFADNSIKESVARIRTRNRKPRDVRSEYGALIGRFRGNLSNIDEINRKKFFKIMYQGFGLEADLDGLDFKDKKIVYQQINNLTSNLDSMSRRDISELAKKTAAPIANLGESQLKDVPTFRQSKSIATSYLDQFSLYHTSLWKAGFDIEEAREIAVNMAFATQGNPVTMHEAMGLPQKFEYKNIGESLNITQLVRVGDSRIKAIGLRALTQEELTSGRAIGIRTGLNIMAGLFGSEKDIVYHKFNRDTGAIREAVGARVGLDHIADVQYGAGISETPEQALGTLGKVKGPLSAKELSRFLRVAKSVDEYGANQTLDTIRRTNSLVKIEHTLRNTKEGIDWGKTTREELDTLSRRILDKWKYNPLRNVSINNMYTLSDNSYQMKYAGRSVDSGAGFTNMREALPLHPTSATNIFAGTELDYLTRHASVLKSIAISDNLNKYIANHIGPTFVIGDGSSLITRTNGKDNLVASSISRRFTIGYHDTDRETGLTTISHKFFDKEGNNILTDEFFGLSKKEKLARLGDKIYINHEDIIGLDKNYLREELKAYADKGIIKNVLQTHRGIEVLYDAIAEPEFSVKMFSQAQKSGARLIDNKTEQRIKALAYGEASGQLRFTEEGKMEFNELTGWKEISFGKLFNKQKHRADAWAKKGAELQHFTTFEHGKMDVLGQILTQQEGDKFEDFMKSVRDKKEFVKGGLADRLRIDLDVKGKGTSGERANAYRMLSLFSQDNRMDADILHTLMVRNGNVAKILRADAGRVSPRASYREASYNYLWKQIQQAYGTDGNSIAQRTNEIVASFETGVEIHGSGGRPPGASHLQLTQMAMSGMDAGIVNSMYESNPDIASDLAMLSSSTENGIIDATKLTQEQAKAFPAIMSLAPEDRRRALNNLGFNIPENAEYVGYNLNHPTNGYKSIPIALMSTNRANTNSYGRDLTESLSQLEKLRASAIATDIGALINPETAHMATDSVEMMHNFLMGSMANMTKEMVKRRAKYGQILTIAPIGGEASDVAQHLFEQGLGEHGFVGEEYLKALAKQKGKSFEDMFEFEDIKGYKGYQRIKYKSKHGLQDLLHLYVREPAQSPNSAMPIGMVLSKDIKGTDSGKYLFIAEGIEKPGKGQRGNFLGITTKSDYDYDSPGLTAMLDLNKNQYKRMLSIKGMLNEQGNRYYNLLRELDPKRKLDKAAEMASLEDKAVLTNPILFDEMAKARKAMERKYGAAPVTKLNQEIAHALTMFGNDDQTIFAGSRYIDYAMSEGLIKSSHLKTQDYIARGNDALNDILKLANKTRGVEAPTEVQFKAKFKQGMNNFYGLSAKPFGDKDLQESYNKSLDLMADSYYKYLRQGGAKSRSATLGVRENIKEFGGGATGIRAALEEITLNKAYGFTSGKGNVVADVARTRVGNPGVLLNEAKSSITEIVTRNKVPITVGLAALGGLAVMNAASASELPARNMPKPTPEPMEPLRDVKAYSRKLRDDVDTRAYDIRINARGNPNKKTLNKLLKGDNSTVRADINYRNSP